MTTTSFSVTVANTTGQSLGYVQSDGFFSPIVLGVPSGTTATHSLGAARFPYGSADTVTVGITAHSGGGQTNAVPLTTTINIVSTAAAAADSVLLPASAVIGQTIMVRNAAATNAIAVFPPGTGTINGGSASASVSLAAGAAAQYTLVAAGTWVVTG